jgi:hypothetical protein
MCSACGSFLEQHAIATLDETGTTIDLRKDGTVHDAHPL